LNIKKSNNNNNNNKTEQTKKTSDLLNNLLNKSFIIVSFSVKPEFAPVLKVFNEIVRRETMSSLSMTLISTGTANTTLQNSLLSYLQLLTVAHYLPNKSPYKTNQNNHQNNKKENQK
jgi:hypothetical protein